MGLLGGEASKLYVSTMLQCCTRSVKDGFYQNVFSYIVFFFTNIFVLKLTSWNLFRLIRLFSVYTFFSHLPC